MTVQVEIGDGLRKPELPAVVRLEDVATVGDAVSRLTLARHQGLVILVNGRLAGWPTALHDGDVVRLLPALGGG